MSSDGLGGMHMMPPPPPPPTFRAPSRESVLSLQSRGPRSAASAAMSTEEDLSFMDAEIKRLHRDMANMLATASSPPSTPNTSRLAFSTSSSSVLPAVRSSPAGDSEDDYSDDEPALSVLRDDLRSTTEKFFERVTPPRGGQRRRASSVATKAVVAATEAQGIRKHQPLRQQQSWNGLNALEKGVGQELMRRASGTSSVSFHSRQSGGSGPLSFSKHGDVGEKGQGRAATPSGVEEGVQRKNSLLEQQGGWGGARVAVESKEETAAVRRLGGSLVEGPGGMPLTDANKRRWSQAPATDGTPRHGTTASLTGWEYGSEAPGRGSAEGGQSRKQSRTHELEDLRARSEEATRTLEALRELLVEEGRSKATEKSGRVREQQAGKLWPTRRKSVDERNSDVASIDRTPLLLQAMENLQQINTELNKALSKQSTGSRRNGHKKGGSTSALLQRQHSLSRHELRQRQKSGQWAGERLMARQPRSSSDLLQRRRFEKGQSEPMSCGVPRYRTQVNRRGSEKVYFELAITQARSTWTVERHVSEFLDLRRSLVSTATDLAAAAAQRQRVGSSSGLSCGRAQQTSQGTKNVGEREERGDGSPASDCDYRRAGESRVPEITIDTGSWFERSRLGAFFASRKREEKLAEKQVLLASWLAKVLADRGLMSPDLVRFLGGDGNVLAQPIVTENVRLNSDDLYTDNAGLVGQDGDEIDDFFKSSESEDSEEEDESESDFEDDLGSLPNGLDGSLVVPDEWALATLATNGGDPGSARGRLEAAMRKRAGVANRRSGRPPVAVVGSPQAPKFPDVAQIVSLGKTKPGEGGTGGAPMKSWGPRDGKRHWSNTMVVESAVSPRGEARRASDDPALRRPRGPSPSSPSPSATLDAFFQAPT